MTDLLDDRSQRLRWAVYAILIAVAVGNMSGRLLAVNSVDLVRVEEYRIRQRLDKDHQRFAEQGLSGDELDRELAARESELREALRLQRPFLSANDRSRWMAIRALVEYGTYEIDAIVGQPTWDTIDMVQHVGWDGRSHLYSSKPPLLMTLLAGEYWIIHELTGKTLGTHPYEIGRVMLFTVNVLPMVLMYVLIAKLVERFGTTDWGRVYVMATATLGTQLTTFAVVLNNHLIAAVSVAVGIYAVVRIIADGQRQSGHFALAGLASAFAAACELPAVAFLAAVTAMLAFRALRQTVVAFLPAALLVAVAFFGTNFIAHGTLTPPYMHRSATDPDDNWYTYTYEVDGRTKQSYWFDPGGIDQGEESESTYAFHVLVGHHGIFSLTPVWLLSVFGIGTWTLSRDVVKRELAIVVFALTVICLVFYIGLRPQEGRNYGGMTSGFRWMYWFVPLWLLMMLPAADRVARSLFGQGCALVLLVFSVLSASFPTWNPWTHPWIYRWMEYCGWPLF